MYLCTRHWKGPRQPQQTLDGQRRAQDSSKLVLDSPRWPSHGTSYLQMTPDKPQTATAGARRLQTDQDGHRLFQRGPMLLQTGPRRLFSQCQTAPDSYRISPTSQSITPPLNLLFHHSSSPFQSTHSGPVIVEYRRK